jgi:PAS domain S-box-containing protein
MVGPMGWLTVIWSMTASACLTLAMMHLRIWLRDRRSRAHVAFSIAAVAVAGVGACELLMLRADTPEEFGLYMRWTHVPLFAVIASIVWFVRDYFGTGRVWLAWAVVAVRAVILIVNFSVWPNVNYTTITALHHHPLPGGESVAFVDGVISPWTRLAQLGSILFLAFLIDATIHLWRRGTHAERRLALAVGGSMTLFVLLAACHTALIQQQVLRMPYMISTAFLVPLMVMAFQLTADVVHVSQLSQLLVMSQSDLREAGERVELAAAAAHLGFWEWDTGRDTLWATDQFREIIGFSSAEKIDFRNYLDKVHPDDRQFMKSAIDHSLREGGDFDRQYRIVLPDGRTRWLGSRGRVDFNGRTKPPLVRGVVFDLTDRKQAEVEAAKHRNELAHLSRVTMLGELSGSLAHELNQPLTAILSNAQAAQRFLAHERPDLEEVRGSLKDIVDEDKRAGEVIYRLRMLFKKGEVEHQSLDVNELVTDVLKFLNSDLVNHMVAARTELAANLPRVRGDRVQLQQVLINLIVNACDAMTSLGTADRDLLVRTEHSQSGGADGRASGVRISVCDHGSGIPPDQLDAVFEPFVTTKNHGMGLGLAVCRTIVSAHAGRLWATNNADRGASFHVALPVNSAGGS